MTHPNFEQDAIHPIIARFYPELFTDTPQKNELKDEAKRLKITKMVMRLFDHWKLSTADQLELLGLSENSRNMLSRYRKGKALPGNRDILDRIGRLLLIHQSLRSLYPENPDICYSWIRRENRYFENLTPLAVMKKGGLLGIFEVARLLEHLVEQ